MQDQITYIPLKINSRLDEIEAEVRKKQGDYETILKFVEETARKFGRVISREERDIRINTKRTVDFQGYTFYAESGMYHFGNGEEISVKKGDKNVITLHCSDGLESLRVTSNPWDTEEERTELLDLARRKKELWGMYKLMAQAMEDNRDRDKSQRLEIEARVNGVIRDANRLGIY